MTAGHARYPAEIRGETAPYMSNVSCPASFVHLLTRKEILGQNDVADSVQRRQEACIRKFVALLRERSSHKSSPTTFASATLPALQIGCQNDRVQAC